MKASWITVRYYSLTDLAVQAILSVSDGMTSFIVVNYRNMIIRKQHNDNKQKSRTMNINQFIFSRTQPKKKLEVIEALTTEELLSVKEETVIKIVKEVGRRVYKSRDKQLYIDGDRRKGNGWNSTIEGVDLIKGRIHLNIYIQYENTDTNSSEEFDKFFDKWNCYRGEIRRLDRHGNGRTYYFNYDKSDKAGKTAPTFQFMRLGYFCVDNKDSKPGHLVFNRSVSLKDGFKKKK